MNSIATDKRGNPYVAGSTDDIFPGQSACNNSSDSFGTDGFVAGITKRGDVITIDQRGTEYPDDFLGIAVAQTVDGLSEEVFVTGYVSDPGDGETCESLSLSHELFVQRYKFDLVGDLDCDGDVDLLDVGLFIDAIQNGPNIYDPKADIDGDGADNLLDVGPFICLLSDM